MLIEKERSTLLLVDVQEKLTPLVMNSEQLVDSCQWLISLANQLDIPVMVTEQYPKGLGQTVDSLRRLVKENIFYEKLSFSVCSDQKCFDQLSTKGDHIIVIGIETSVCILQTVMELIKQAKKVFVVVDAVSARYQQDHELALERMKESGAQLISKEMVLFEWLRTSAHKQFKEISQEYLKS